MPALDNAAKNEVEPVKIPKPKNYREVFPGVQVLLGTYSQAHKSFGISSRNKQSPATCIVAAVYNKILPAIFWEKKDLEKILSLGDKLYRASVSLIPLKQWQVLKPHCVHPTFYVGENKVTIFVGNDMVTGETSPDNPKIIEIIPELLDKHYAVIANIKDRHFALWKQDDNYYLFCPHDGNEAGALLRIGMGKCFVICFEDIDKLCEYLCTLTCGRFSIYSIRILKLTDMATAMSDLIEQFQSGGRPPHDEMLVSRRTTIAPLTDVLPPAYFKDIMETADMFNVRTNSRFSSLSDGMGSIVYKSHETDVDMILYDNLAAIITLHKYKSASWSAHTIGQIFALANDMSTLEFNLDTHISNTLDVRAHDKSYRLHFDKVVFGKVTSKDETIPTITNSLEPFFTNYDVGMIQGPQSLAVWKERGLFFSFDAKERDGLGRKWRKMIAKELGPVKKGGGACVLWCDDPKKLAQTYIGNVPIEHRNDFFRLIHIKIEELVEGEYWNFWPYISPGKWMLEGAESFCKHLQPKDVDERGQILSAACYILAYLVHYPEPEWTSELLNNLIKTSFEFYKFLQQKKLDEFQATHGTAGEVEFDPEENALFVDNSKITKIEDLSDIGNIIPVEGKNTLLAVEECVVNGECTPDTPDSVGGSGLKAGIASFFQNHRSGIFIMDNTILIIWTDGTAYYLLDFSERMNLGRTATKSSNFLGNVSAIRFEALSDLLDVITSNPKYLGCKTFCITKIEASYGEGAELPLRHYAPFGDRAAILIQPDFHEGHQIFEPRAEKQTLCNVLIALCLASINDAVEWSKGDLVDIIRTGDKIYAKLSEDFAECEMNHREITWDEIKPVIGVSSFTFNRQEFPGIIAKAIEPEAPPEEEVKEEAKEEAKDANAPAEAANADAPPANPEENPDDLDDDETVVEPDTIEIILRSYITSVSFNAILQCDFFHIAVWKHNGLYFVFDPKANDETGNPTPRRIQMGKDKIRIRYETERGQLVTLYDEGAKDETERTKEDEVDAEEAREIIDAMTLPHEGSAYVAWFQTFDRFLDHILSKVPEEDRENPFTFNALYIDRTIISPQKIYLNSYEEREENGIWILRASISQNDDIFPNKSYIDGASSIIALAFTMLATADEWSPTIVDIILKYGDRLYTKSLITALAHDGKSKLKLKQMSKVFSIYKFRFESVIREADPVLTINNPQNLEEINPLLVESISKIGKEQKFVGIIVILNHNYHVALWKTDDIIYVFDPYGNDADGRYNGSGVSCVLRFANNEMLFKLLRRKFNNVREIITYQIAEVEMLFFVPVTDPIRHRTHFEFSVPAAQSAFVANESDDIKTLQACYTGASITEIFIDLAAIVLSHLLHADCWTPTIINKVFSLAQNFQENSTKITMNIGADKLEMDLKGLVRCFTIDDTICTLNIDEVIRGPIKPKDPTDVSLRNSVTLLLRNYARAVVITASYLCAIWREADNYYLFSSTNKDGRPFVMTSTYQNAIYDWMVSNVPQADVYNWYEIIRIEICSIKKNELEKTKSKKLSKMLKVKNKSMCMDQLTERKKERTQESIELYKRGKAACIVAAGMAHLKDIYKWRKDVFDIISRSALLLYMDSVAVQGRTSIEMVDMEKFFLLNQTQMQVEAMPPTEDEATLENILRIFSHIYLRFKIAYASSPSDNFLAVHTQDRFYIFQPEKISLHGHHCNAYVEQFQTLEELANALTDYLSSYSGKVLFGAIHVLILK